MSTPSHYLKLIAERLHNRPDSEHEQALIRILIPFTFLVYLLITKPEDNLDNAIWMVGFLFISTFIVFSIALFVSIIINPGQSNLRRIIGMFADIGAFSFGLAITGELGAPWYAVYLWVTFGNGFRYGEKYLYLSAVLSVIGFSTVLMITPYWQEQVGLGLGLLAALIVLPGYAGVLSKRLHAERRRAEEASRAKSEFLARMSHEIRTPLNGIIATGELLKSCKLGPEEQEYVDTIHASGSTLLRIIEDILDISKIEAGKLEIEQTDFDLHALINTTNRMLQPQADKKNLRLSCHIGLETPYRLKGDPLHLRQILINLLGNAVKFTETGSVELHCYQIRGDNDRSLIRFEVVDTGIGMSEQEQARIFEKFSQADESTTRRFGGTGLGTTIAKQLVELMGGRIGIKSTPRIGTTFWFDIEFDHQEEMIDESEMIRIRSCHVLRLSNRKEEHTDIVHSMSGWGVPFLDVTSVEAASRILMEAAGTDSGFKVLVFDNFPINTEAKRLIASLDRKFTSMDITVLIYNNSSDTIELPESLGTPIYRLPTPLDKTQLFNALHASHASSYDDESVINLADHRIPGVPVPAGLRVLVAEDNEINRMVIGRILERAGLHFKLVENGQEALDELEEAEYDAVIVDMQMPVLGGLEAYKMYRFAYPSDEPVPFIVLTANATVDARLACEEVGIKHFLTKPISATKLLNTIAIAAAKASLNEDDLLPRISSTMSERRNIIDPEIVQQIALLAPDSEFLVRLVEKFDQDFTQILSGMTDATKGRDIEHFRHLAHALKGSAANLGLIELQTLASEAEKLSDSALPTEGSLHIEALRKAFQQAVPKLHQALELPSPAVN
jgi:two-component system sensor histidine kinase RpfC